MSDQIPANALAYLATPYTKWKDGIDDAFVQAAKIAALLMRSGIKVYSPIAHTHPLAIHGNIDPFDHAIWLPFDQAMMDACGVLIVAHMDGWQESKGVMHEIDYFMKARKPIFDLPNPHDPSHMEKRKRAIIRERYQDLKPEEFRQQANEYLEQ